MAGWRLLNLKNALLLGHPLPTLQFTFLFPESGRRPALPLLLFKEPLLLLQFGCFVLLFCLPGYGSVTAVYLLSG